MKHITHIHWWLLLTSAGLTHTTKKGFCFNCFAYHHYSRCEMHNSKNTKLPYYTTHTIVTGLHQVAMPTDTQWSISMHFPPQTDIANATWCLYGMDRKLICNKSREITSTQQTRNDKSGPLKCKQLSGWRVNYYGKQLAVFIVPCLVLCWMCL